MLIPNGSAAIGPRLPSRSEGGELALEVVEPEAALAERGHVPRLEVEGVPVRRSGGLTPREPGPLTQLVADGLPRHTQIADQLAVQQSGVAPAVLPEKSA